jgi:hypothetical protein
MLETLSKRAKELGLRGWHRPRSISRESCAFQAKRHFPSWSRPWSELSEPDRTEATWEHLTRHEITSARAAPRSCGPGGRGFESHRSPLAKPPLSRGFRRVRRKIGTHAGTKRAPIPPPECVRST